MKRFLPILFAASKFALRYARNIAPSTGVSASGVRHRRFDEQALLAHDLAHKHSFKSWPSKENIHETQSNRRCRNNGCADAARAGEQYRR
jgi:hypothetical protein